MTFIPELSRRLHDTPGPEAATDLMNWMQEQDEQRGEFRDVVRADIAELRQDMTAGLAQLRQEMTAGFGQLRQEMTQGAAQLRQELAAGFAQAAVERAAMETRFERRFNNLIKWSFVFWCGAVGSIALPAHAFGA